MKRKGKRLLSMMAAMIVVLTTILAPSSVAATEKIDISKSGSASLVLELPAASDSVKLYQIADYDGDSKIVMKKEATDLKVTIDGKESEAALGQKAQTLAGKLKTAAATGKTDAKLNVKFEKLKLGYYLVIVEKCGSDSKKYEVAPVIVSVPAVQKSSWKYDVTVKLKGQEVKTTPAPATTTPKAPTTPGKDETVGADDDSSTDSGVTPPSPIPTEVPTETETPSPTLTETETPSPTPTETETPSLTQAATETPSSTPTETENPELTPTSIQLSVVKYWKDKNGNELDDKEIGVESLPIQIYRREKDSSEWKLYKTATLTADSEWRFRWSAADDGANWTVSENDVPEGYILQTPIERVDNEINANLEFRITNVVSDPTPTATPTSTPTPTPTATVHFNVKKVWLNAEGAVLDSRYTGVSSLTIDIFRKGADDISPVKVNSVELNASNGWSRSWTGPDDGSTWTVAEPNTPAGYTNVDIVEEGGAYSKTFTIINKKTSPNDSTESIPTEPLTPTPDTESDDSHPGFPPDDSSIPDITVTPDPNMWQMSVTKYWIDKNNLPLSDKDETIPESLFIQIWKKAAAAAKWEKVELVELTAENGWTYSWMAPDDEATWTVTEDVTPIGFTQMTIKQSKNTAKKTLAFKVTNMSNADVTPAPIQLSVVKYWKDKNGNDLDDKEISVKSLPIQIYRREKDAKTWKLYKTVELTAETAWEYHWGAADDGASWTVTERDVPEGYVLQTPIKLAHNKDNTKLEFRVTNISTAGGDITPTPTDTPTPTPKSKTPTPTKKPTNTPTPRPANLSFSVVKKWQTASGGTLSSSQTGVSSLTVDIYRKYPGATSYTKVDTIELLPSNNWTHSWTAPDDGSTWTVTEPRIPSGYTKVGITQAKNSDKHTWLFTITNKKTSSSDSGSKSGSSSVTRKVTATATPKVTGSSHTTPNTGDNQNIWIPIMTMFGASVVLVVLARKRAR